MIDITTLQSLCTDDTIMVTKHLADRMHERDIKYSHIKQAILDGEIIEDYPEDYPFPSCLILGCGLHVVAGVGDGLLWIITAYRASLDKWEPDLKTRRKKP